MTKNQIEFNKLLETKRANMAQEGLTGLRDSRTYEVAMGNLTELRRSNLEKERHNWATLDETRRSHLATERETMRSNLVREGETERSNRAREEETKRNNVAQLVELNRSNTVRENYQAQQIQLDQEVRRAQLAETKSYNERLFSQQQRVLNETIRSNKAHEAISWSQLSESRRANLENESYRRDSLAEIQRSNLIGENIRQQQIDLGYSQLEETARSNEARESETNRSNLARESETARHNVASETEMERSNRESESNTKRGQNFQLLGSVIQGVSRVAGSYINLKGRQNNGSDKKK